MAVTDISPPFVLSDGRKVRWIVADTAAEVPADLPEGSRVWVRETEAEQVKAESGWSMTASVDTVTSTVATSAAIPSGIICMWSGLVLAIPSGWKLCDGQNGTPDLRDRFIMGAGLVTLPGATGGANTHGHTDHAALSHSAHAGAAVDAHAVTQPGAHSNHVVTQPGAHSNHVVTQPNNHTDVLNHVHLEQLQGGTTGATTGTHIMASTATGGSLRSAGQSTLNPTTGGVAAQAHGGTAVDAHSAHSGAAVDAHSAHSGAAVGNHSVTQPGAHTDHSVQSHSSSSNVPAYYALAFIMKV